MIWKKLFSSVLPLLFLSACAAPTEYTQTKTVWVMDTACTVTLCGGDPETVSALLSTLDRELDNYTPDSAVSHLNQEGILSDTSHVYDLVSRTLAYNERFGGLVDLTVGALTKLWGIATETPHVPSQTELDAALSTVSPAHITAADNTVTLADGAQLDAGAVAKGYGLDCVKSLLDESGETSYGTVSMTSSILFYGKKPDEKPFTVEIRDPNGDGILGTVATEACFLSTSGGYERYFTADDGKEYCHILDPSTGMPAESDLTTVTVFCGSGLQSDFLSTLIWLEGTENISRHLQAADYNIVAQDTSGTLYVSDGLQFEAAPYKDCAADIQSDFPSRSE